MGVKDEMQTCVMKHVSKMEQGKEPEVTPEVCSNIGTGVKECVLKMKIDCFSKRENKVLTEIIGTAFEDAKEVYAMDEVQKGLEKKMSANQKKLVECALGSGSGSGRSSLMVEVERNANEETTEGVNLNEPKTTSTQKSVNGTSEDKSSNNNTKVFIIFGGIGVFISLLCIHENT